MSTQIQRRGLDALQRGHLRHMANLARQPPNDWLNMKGRGFGQDDFGGYRFQLAYMAYALALTHVHRLPAAPGVFKPLLQTLVEKMLLPEVWMYWHNASRGGTIFNQHLSHAYEEQWDPVARDNIMYSAYVQSMALLYHYLFRDNRFAAEGALTFKFWSYFWGGEPKVFSYDENSLNEHIYWLMVQSGYLGVACEPNCIFQICNQPAILGFRLHDLITNGTRAAEVTQSYELAWREFGHVGDNGHYHVMLSQDTKKIRPNTAGTPWVDAWCGALMNMWNRDFVRTNYPRQIKDLIIEGPNETLSVKSPPRPLVMGEKVVSDDCDFGWVAAWSSEMGDTRVLEGLLGHADCFMQPSWRAGGLYYPRSDQMEDGLGNRTLMEPHTGNVLLGYARLNISDGLWHLYNEPLGEEFFGVPSLTRVGEDVELYRAFYEEPVLTFTAEALPVANARVSVEIERLPSARSWILRCDGVEIARGRGTGFANSSSLTLGVREDALVIICPSSGVHDFALAFQ
jgi:hypothetical protein